MRKLAIFLLFMAPLFFKPLNTQASEVPPNLETLTSLSSIIFTGECLSLVEREMEVKSGVQRKVIENVFRVDEVIKNESGVSLEQGQDFTFVTLAPASATIGGNFWIFLKPFFNIHAFTGGGDRGVFKIEKDPQEELFVRDQFNNINVMVGIDDAISRATAKGVSIKTLTPSESETLRHIQGPIKLNQFKKFVPMMIEIDKERKTRLERERIEKAKKVKAALPVPIEETKPEITRGKVEKKDEK